MAVWQQAYQGYTGPRRASMAPPTVIARYAIAEVFSSRLFVAFYFVSLIPVIAILCVMYMRYNLEFLSSFQISLDELVTVDGAFFARYVQLPQTVLALGMVIVVGPGLVSPDLRNNALPLYLSRAITRHHYVAGKLLAIVVLGSALMWIPGWALVLFQTMLEGSDWLFAHLHIPFAMLVCSLTWLVSFGTLALAVSTWVKWKQIARVALFALVFVGAASGEVIRDSFGGWGGSVLSILDAMEALIGALFMTGAMTGMPASAAVIVFLVVTALSMLILYRRIRAYEVVV